MTDVLHIWMVAYAVPAFLAGTVIKILPKSKSRLNIRNALIMCTTLAISVAVTQYFIYSLGLEFPWRPDFLSVALCIASLIISYRLMSLSGLAYWAYCLMQKFTLLSITFLLLPRFPLGVVIFMVVPFFVWCHPFHIGPQRLLRTAIFIGWGIISLSLFSILPNIYIITAIHSVLGAWLMSKSILYSEVYADVTNYLKA